jgi:hypothetical protein
LSAMLLSPAQLTLSSHHCHELRYAIAHEPRSAAFFPKVFTHRQ